MCSDSRKQHILHVLTKPRDDLAAAILQAHQEDERMAVQVVFLTGDHPDYDGLLEAVFAADAVHVW